ncbi:DUF4112 domain-containing protein [Pseudomonadota bacterium]
MEPKANPEGINEIPTLDEGAERAESQAEDDPVTATRVDSRDRVYETVLDLTPEQKQIVADLRASKHAQNWSEILAKYADQYHIEDFISLIPVLGDGATNIVCGLFLLYHAKKAGLDWKGFSKIVLLQLGDFGTGVFPVLGDAADFAFKANQWSTYEFIKRTEALCDQARKAGIPEEEIQILLKESEAVKKRNDKIANIGGGVASVAGGQIKKRKLREIPEG